MIYPFWTAANSSLEVTVVSDRLEPVTGTAQLTWYDWTGKELNTSTHSFTTPALNNSLIFSASGLDNILPAGSSASDVWLRMNLTADTKMGTVVNEQYVR
jgi:beta-mannosidase